MAEAETYFHEIFGQGALQTTFVLTETGIEGHYSQDPGFLRLEQDAIIDMIGASIFIHPSHISGHFQGFPTFPAYRMLELGGLANMAGATIFEISDARFNRIVQAEQYLSAEVNEQQAIVHRYVASRGEFQEAATFTIKSPNNGELGLQPHEVGIVLEVASQTLVAHAQENHNLVSPVLYPLILSVGNIKVWRNDLGTGLIARPVFASEVTEKRMFSGSVEVYTDQNEPVAHVRDIQFMFASEAELAIFNGFKMNS